MNIWVASIEHRHGSNLYAATTDEGIYAQLAAYCREWWAKDGPPVEGSSFPANEPPEGMTAPEIVSAYFNHADEEFYSIDEIPLIGSEP